MSQFLSYNIPPITDIVQHEDVQFLHLCSKEKRSPVSVTYAGAIKLPATKHILSKIINIFSLVPKN